MPSDTPRVQSFIVRFVEDVPDDAAAPGSPAWRGVIIHVQTDEEKAFTHLADAVTFISRYVPLGDMLEKEE